MSISPEIVVPVPVVLEERLYYFIRDVDTQRIIKHGECMGNTWLTTGKNALAAAVGTESNVNYFNRVYVKRNGTPEYTASQNHQRTSNVLTIDSGWFTNTGTYSCVIGSKDANYYNSISTNIEILTDQEIKYQLEYTFTGPGTSGQCCAARIGAIGDGMDHAIGTIQVTGNVKRASSNSTIGNKLECKNTTGFTFGSQTDVTSIEFKLNVEGTNFATYTTGFTIPVATTEEFYVKATFTFG